MTSEEQFIARLIYTNVTAYQLWKSNNDSPLYRPDLGGYVTLADIYVTDLKILLPTGSHFMFTQHTSKGPGIRMLYGNN